MPRPSFEMMAGWRNALRSVRVLVLAVAILRELRGIVNIGLLFLPLRGLMGVSNPVIAECGEGEVTEADISHPMRNPLLTRARIGPVKARLFQVRCTFKEQRYQLCMYRQGTRLILINSYLELPPDILHEMLRIAVQRFLLVSRIDSQRNEQSYVFMHQTEEKEYLADLSTGFEAYQAALGKKTRFNIRYYGKKLQADFPALSFRFLPQGELQRSDFKAFVELAVRRYPGKYWDGFQEDRLFEAFRRDVAVTVLEINGKLAACNIFYVVGDTLIFTGNSFDEQYAEWSLGFLMTYRSIEYAAQLGFRQVVLGLGDFGYKARLSNRTRKVYECWL